MTINIQTCTETQLPEILEIFNDTILNSTALYDYKIKTSEVMNIWYMNKTENNYPILGAFSENNILLGFATYSLFRSQPAYKYTVEHSVYVQKDNRGLGIGKILLKEIIKKAEEQGFHTLIGVIDASNKTSIKLHEKEGFILTGILKEAGFKFGKWLDTAFYQIILRTPIEPKDD